MSYQELLDALALLSVDTRTDREEPLDPVVEHARWLWHELVERQRKREEMRLMLLRMPAISPTLDI